MADANWIKLNRGIWDNFLWNFDRPQYALAWIDILLLANYKDKTIMLDGKPVTVKRGSFVTSLVKLSERWGMDRRTVKRFLDVLRDDGMIVYVSTKRCTTVFVTNYLVYQGIADSGNSPNAQLNVQPNAQLNVHNIRRLKKVKESKEDIAVSNDTARCSDEQRILQAWNSLGLKKIIKIVPGTERHTMLNKRIKDYGVDGILAAIEKVRESNFLMGGGDNGWTATFDWFIKPNKFPKVLEGNYDNSSKPSAQVQSTSGRKEMVPERANRTEAQKIQEDHQRVLRALGNDPELAARAEILKKKLQGGDPDE